MFAPLEMLGQAVTRRLGRLRVMALCVFLVACQSGSHGPTPTPTGAGGSASQSPAVMRLIEFGSMHVARAVHTQTELADGRVLIVGGCTNAGCDTGSSEGATSELFDPATRTFTLTGSLRTSRDDHAAVRLADGRVLIAGGWGGEGVLAGTEIYDPATGVFSDGPTMSSARAGFAATVLADGRVLLAGGYTGNHSTTATADLFDPTGNAILTAAPLRKARGSYATARLPDGRVLIVGGHDDGRALADAELFDPATSAFAPTGSMETARLKFAAAPLRDGSIIVMGGANDIEGRNAFGTTEIYDPLTGQFRDGPRMNEPRYKLLGSTVILPDGAVLVAGGASRPEVLSPTADAFRSVAGSLGGTRLFPAAAAVGGGSVLITGGYDERIVPTRQAWVYEPSP
jgi:hypothetical protein